MVSHTRRTVLNDGIPISCHDYAGTGPDVVLMHGAGMQERSLRRLIGHLTAEFRIVTFDFRGHGDTPSGTWTLDTAVSDLEAVIAAYELETPAVGGHSLGGMVAAEYARRHPNCTAAINIDGHGIGKPEQYVGKDPAIVAQWIETVHAKSQELRESPLVKALITAGKLRGQKPADPEVLKKVLHVTRDLDLIEIYREVAAPLLVFNAHAPSRGLAAHIMKDPDQLLSAYRAGIRRDLTVLSDAKPNVVMAEIDATHMLIRTHAAQTAAQMTWFLRDRMRQTG